MGRFMPISAGFLRSEGTHFSLLGKSHGVGTCGSGTDRKRPPMNAQRDSVWRDTVWTSWHTSVSGCRSCALLRYSSSPYRTAPLLISHGRIAVLVSDLDALPNLNHSNRFCLFTQAIDKLVFPSSGKLLILSNCCQHR